MTHQKFYEGHGLKGLVDEEEDSMMFTFSDKMIFQCTPAMMDELTDAWLAHRNPKNPAEPSPDNRTFDCPHCGVEITTCWPPQEVPPGIVICHSCGVRIVPKTVRRLIDGRG